MASFDGRPYLNSIGYSFLPPPFDHKDHPMTDMIKSRALASLRYAVLTCALVAGSVVASHPAMADGVEELNRDSDSALQNLIAHNN